MDAPIRGTRVLIVVFFFLNLLDALLTWIVVPSGRAYEINPVAAWLLERGDAQFLSVKILVVSAALAWMWVRLPRSQHGFLVLCVMAVLVAVWLVIVGLLLVALCA